MPDDPSPDANYNEDLDILDQSLGC
jgi:hypothetical protein